MSLILHSDCLQSYSSKQLAQSIRLELKYLGIDFEDVHYVQGPGVCTCEGYVVYVMVCTCACTYTYIHICVSVCAFACMHACMCVCVCVCVCVCMCIVYCVFCDTCVFVCVCACAYICMLEYTICTQLIYPYGHMYCTVVFVLQPSII